jgi:small multidrug resistance pump
MLTLSRRRFYQKWFLAATIYNLVWGILVILFPRVPFELAGISLGQPDTIAISFWQCIGMFVMVFAIGYYYLWKDPERYAPFALIALLGKIFGPIGFVWCWYHGTIPGHVGFTIITNDLIWWPAFGMFLYETMWRDKNVYQLK